MKRTVKTVTAFLLSVIMALSMFGGVALAEENVDPGYHPVDAYVINFSGADLEELLDGYEATMPLLYTSGHYGKIKYSNTNTSDAAAEIMNLINTSKLKNTPEEERVGAYASLPAYCVDAFVKAKGKEGCDYVRMNLEDASYFVEGAAGKVRAMYLNSFPYINNIEDVQDNVNAWLRTQDPNATLLTDLTAAEASSATQMAIWTTVHGSDVMLDKIYDRTVTYSLDELKEFVCYPSGEYYGFDCQEEGKSTTEYNMKMVFDYMKDLAPAAPASVVVSEASFVNKEMTVARNAAADSNEAYSIRVKAVVDVAMQQGDSMILSAKLGDEIQNIALANGKKEYTFVFDKVAAPADVVLEINGTQTATDVFFFSPRNGRFASQSMVAADSSQLPVHAETTVKVDRIITFDKTTIIEKNGVATTYPLEGIEFEIYYAGTVDEYTQWIKDNGRDVVTVTEGEKGNKIVTVDEDYAAAAKAKGVLATVKTDVSGKALYNITEAEQPDGIYMVVEKANSAVVAPLPAFLVAVPGTTNDGTGLTYTINLQPKNEVYPGPEVEKDINVLGQQEDSVGVGEIHTWIISGDIPMDMADGKSYVLTDIMDYRLTYKDLIKVAVEREVVDEEASVEGEEPVYKTESTVLDDAHYKLTVGKTKDKDNNDIDIFKLNLTEAGMDAVAEIAATEGTEREDWKVRVYFNAIVDEDAVVGVTIPNEVTLDYKNFVGIEFSDMDDAQVYTCGLNIYKYDAKDEKTALSATFQLAKEVVAETPGATKLVVEKGKSINVVYVDFYNTDEIVFDDEVTAEDEGTPKVNSLVTDSETGKAMIYGLEAGDYYLVETKAPAGYNLLSYPIKVTLNATSHASVVNVANSNTFELPGTGGIGTTIFTLVGAALTLGSGAVLAGKKRKEETEE